MHWSLHLYQLLCFFQRKKKKQELKLSKKTQRQELSAAEYRWDKES